MQTCQWVAKKVLHVPGTEKKNEERLKFADLPVRFCFELLNHWMDKSTKCVHAEKNADAPRLPNVTLLLRILPWRPLPTLPHPRVSVSHLPRPEGKESLDVKRSISSRPFRFRLVSPCPKLFQSSVFINFRFNTSWIISYEIIWFEHIRKLWPKLSWTGRSPHLPHLPHPVLSGCDVPVVLQEFSFQALTDLLSTALGQLSQDPRAEVGAASRLHFTGLIGLTRLTLILTVTTRPRKWPREDHHDDMASPNKSKQVQRSKQVQTGPTTFHFTCSCIRCGIVSSSYWSSRNRKSVKGNRKMQFQPNWRQHV